MSSYAIGDLQGCYTTLQYLLKRIAFVPGQDRLWFVGDLVNRGADSLACLRTIKALGTSATVVLGNHDLHLLAMAEGIGLPNPSLQPVLDAPDRAALLTWLRTQKLFHHDGAHAMVHAGVHPAWSLAQAAQRAHEVETALHGPDYRDFLSTMYGNKPSRWRDDLHGMGRLRLILNVMTRMRMLKEDGALDFDYKGALTNAPPSLQPWFAIPRPGNGEGIRLITGHWSALGLYQNKSMICLDTGCVWGRELTAYRLEDGAIFQAPCAEAAPAIGSD